MVFFVREYDKQILFVQNVEWKYVFWPKSIFVFGHKKSHSLSKGGLLKVLCGKNTYSMMPYKLYMVKCNVNVAVNLDACVCQKICSSILTHQRLCMIPLIPLSEIVVTPRFSFLSQKYSKRCLKSLAEIISAFRMQ